MKGNWKEEQIAILGKNLKIGHNWIIVVIPRKVKIINARRVVKENDNLQMHFFYSTSGNQSSRNVSLLLWL